MKNESRPQKTSISVTKRVFSIVVIVIILTNVFVYASQLNDVTYDNQPFNSATSILFSSRWNSEIVYTPNVNTEGSYLALHNNGSIGRVFLFRKNPYSSQLAINDINISHIDSILNNSGQSYREYYYIDVKLGDMYTMTNINIPSYGSYDNIQKVIDDFIDVYGEPGTNENNSYNLNYNLPAGNVAYIEFNNDFDSFTLKTTMPTTSYIVGSNLWDTTQTYGFDSTLPSGSLTIPSTTIPWQRDGALSITGVTNKAVFDYGPHHPTSGNYLVICNPAYYGGTANGPYEFLNNGSIQIQAENVVDLKVYQLNSNLAPIPGSNDRLDVTTEGTGVVYEPTFDPETGELVWPDNQEPVVGGGNLTVSSEDGFKSFLSNLVERIKGIFEPAHDAIQTLATAVSNFATTLRALYIWLPSPVLNILTSAIILAITIGIVKVFI